MLAWCLIGAGVVGCSANVSVVSPEPRETEDIDSGDLDWVVPPAAIEPEPPSDVRRSEVIVVCPVAFHPALQPWVQRREQQAMMVTVLNTSPDTELLAQTIANSNKGNCRYVLLVGDAIIPGGEDGIDQPNLVPTFYQDADVSKPYQQTRELPGDFRFGDFDRDGIIDAAVGRLPVKTAAQLTALIDRIIDYEDSRDFGRWRSRVDLVAGLGGFGTMIDRAIEMVAGGIITGALPGSVRTRITHAGPASLFHPGTQSFTDTVLDNYRDGARFWVYAGHGWITELDRVPSGPVGRPVLSMTDLPMLDRPHSSAPIALILACYTGAFDALEDSLAERMLLADFGPIAVIAGSRVTMPYGNAATAIGLIRAIYNDDAARLGDAWLASMNELATASDASDDLKTRRMMIDGIASVAGGGARMDDERREHMQLYNLLGDPTLLLGTVHDVVVDDQGDAVVGQPIVVRGQTPISGTMVVEVHRRLGSLPIATNAENVSRYIEANDTVITSTSFDVEAGPWQCAMPTDRLVLHSKTTSLPITIKVEVIGHDGYAAGSRAAWLRTPVVAK